MKYVIPEMEIVEFDESVLTLQESYEIGTGDDGKDPEGGKDFNLVL